MPKEPNTFRENRERFARTVLRDHSPNVICLIPMALSRSAKLALKRAKARQKPRVAIKPLGSRGGEKTPPEPTQAEETEVLTEAEQAERAQLENQPPTLNPHVAFEKPVRVPVYEGFGQGVVAIGDEHSFTILGSLAEAEGVERVSGAETGTLRSEAVLRLFLASQQSKASRKAYLGDLKIFARWLKQEPTEAVLSLISANAADGTELVRRWLAQASNLSVLTRNRRLSSLKALVRFANEQGNCSWLLELPGLKPNATDSLRIAGDSLRYGAMICAMGRLPRNVVREELHELLQPEEVSCLRFTKEH